MTTTVSSNSLAQDSRIFLSNLAGASLKVASSTASDVTVDDASPLTGTGLYSANNPGTLVVLSGQSAGDAGKTSKITGVASNTLTTDVDLSSVLGDGDKIAVVPPMAVELFTRDGHSLEATTEDDETMGLSETFLTHATRSLNRVGGSIPVFAGEDSEGLARVLLAGVGGYNKSATLVHDFAPFKADTSTYAEVDEFSAFTIDGNSVVQQGWYDLFGTSLTIDIPENGIVTADLEALGAGVVRIVGGTGKDLPSGYITSDGTDRGFRHSSHGCLVELGGSFGDAISDSNDKFFTSASVNIQRGALEDTALGQRFIIRPDEEQHKLTINATRFLEDDTNVDFAWGSDEPEPGSPTETRAVFHLVSANNASRILTIDVPNAKVRRTTTRQRGRFREDVTIEMVASLDANKEIDSSTPPYRIRYNNNLDVDLSTAL